MKGLSGSPYLAFDPVGNSGDVVFAEGFLLSGGEVLEVDKAGGLI